MSADVKMVSRENSDLKKELERVKKELEETKTTAGKSSDVGREMTRLRQDLDRLTQKNMELAKKVETGAAGGKHPLHQRMPEPMLMVHLVVMVSSWRKSSTTKIQHPFSGRTAS